MSTAGNFRGSNQTDHGPCSAARRPMYPAAAAQPHVSLSISSLHAHGGGHDEGPHSTTPNARRHAAAAVLLCVALSSRQVRGRVTSLWPASPVYQKPAWGRGLARSVPSPVQHRSINSRYIPNKTSFLAHFGSFSLGRSFLHLLLPCNKYHNASILNQETPDCLIHSLWSSLLSSNSLAPNPQDLG